MIFSPVTCVERLLQTRESELRVFLNSSQDEPTSGSVRGFLFEQFAHMQLCAGGEFEVRELVASSQQGTAAAQQGSAGGGPLEESPAASSLSTGSDAPTTTTAATAVLSSSGAPTAGMGALSLKLAASSPLRRRFRDLKEVKTAADEQYCQPSVPNFPESVYGLIQVRHWVVDMCACNVFMPYE